MLGFYECSEAVGIKNHASRIAKRDGGDDIPVDYLERSKYIW